MAIQYITRGGQVSKHAASTSMRMNTLLIHLPVCVSHATNLQHVVWTRHLWVSLYVEGFQELQDYSGTLRQTDGVLTLTHGGVGIWVVWTGQNPRQGGQHLADAWHCRQDLHSN